MSMFIQDDDLIEVKVYCRKKGHKFEVYSEKDFQSAKIKEEDKGKYECLTVKMKSLTWGLYNQLQEEAYMDNPSGEKQFSFRLYKENKLKKLIKEWDAKNKEGKPVVVNDGSISHLAPSVAEVLLKSYDDASILGEEEEKN